MKYTYDALLIQPQDQMAMVFFNRPAAANALNVGMALEIKHFFSSLSQTSFRAVILTGQGKHFCAGADLKERKGVDDATWQAQHHAFEGALQAIMQCDIPVIAAVNGSAFGGGLELAMACDFIYASDSARFAMSEATLGIMPGLGGTQTLPRAIGMGRAKELLFSGRVFSAAEAFSFGLANRQCTDDVLLSKAIASAKTIAANAPLSVKAIKKSVNEGAVMPITQALQCELKHYATLLPTRDRREGIAAFNEKRKPVFTGE